ncbi:MAG: hypothetical protein U0163_01710 [Gemmatimonadaceae bacterium]
MQSQNVIAEIKGSQFPDEVVAMGGHTDSWDVKAAGRWTPSAAAWWWRGRRFVS